MISQRAVLANLSGILQYGVQIRRGDRFTSWLPYYHDMGLVGLILGPVVSQLSVRLPGDPRVRDASAPVAAVDVEQSARPISFSPPFGYALCARRLRESDLERFEPVVLAGWPASAPK